MGSSASTGRGAAPVGIHFLRGVFASLHLPVEIQDHIAGYVLAANQEEDTTEEMDTTPIDSRVAFIPPLDGTAPFLKLPAELRRRIFADSLPAYDVVYYPHCKGDGPDAHKASNTEPGQQPRRNRISDLMTLNRTIRDEIAEVVYEERCFVIHVHEGLRNGGIEFLDAGRQPLQYKDLVEDPRFHRFGENDDFGFGRLKKIIIVIHPPTETFNRHSVFNTYFMNLALCHMMERHRSRSNRIKNLEIRFAQSPDASGQVGRAVILRTEQRWFDPDKQRPRETSVHNLSNIELVLRPFANLIGCHAVSIELPPSVRNHQPTIAFVDALKESMMSLDDSAFTSDDLKYKIEGARVAMNDFINYTFHGTKHHHVELLTADEMRDDDEADEGSPPADERGIKRNLSVGIPDQCKSPKRKALAGSSASNPIELDKPVNKATIGQRKGGPAPKESLHDAEERMIETATRASLNDVAHPPPSTSSANAGNPSLTREMPIRSRSRTLASRQAAIMVAHLEDSDEEMDFTDAAAGDDDYDAGAL